MKSRRWSKDERILALDLYFSIHSASSRPIPPNRNLPQIVELSKILGRTRDSIKMKLDNFLPLDKNYPGKGLSHLTKEDKEVWYEFLGRRRELAEEAQKIRARMTETEEGDSR